MKYKFMHKFISLIVCVTMVIPFISPATVSYAKEDKEYDSIATPTDADEDAAKAELMASGNCYVNYNGQITSGATTVGSFTLSDGTRVYCGDHYKETPGSGWYNSASYTGNENVRKVICYIKEKGITDVAAASLAVHNAVHGDNHSLGISILNDALSEYPDALLTIAESELSLEVDGDTARTQKLVADKVTLINNKQYKMTEFVTLYGSSKNSITITVPSDLYMRANATWYKSGTSVTLKGGQKFRFAVPIDSTETYKVTGLTGKVGCDVYKITTSSGCQDLYYGETSTSSVSITITGEDINGGLKIRKRAQNSKDSMSGVKFNIYKVSGDGKDGGTLIATATVTGTKVSETGSYYKTRLSDITEDAKELGVYIDKSGNEQVLKCPVGWYRIEEDADTVPEGYIVHDDVWKEVVKTESTYTVHIINKKETGGIATLTKEIAVVGNEYSAEGLKYTVYKVASNKAEVNTGTKIADAVIDASGDAVFTLTSSAESLDISLSDDQKTLEDLPYGWYVAVEDAASATSLNLSVAANQYKELSESNREITFSFTDSVKPIVISVKKTSTSEGTSCTFDTDNNMYSLAGAEFTVYEDAACTKVAKSYTVDSKGYINGVRDKTVLVTDENGNTRNLYFIPAAKKGTKYYIKETKAPKGYKLSDEKKEVYLHPTEQAKNNLTFADEPIADPESVEVYKQDAATGKEVQGGGSLAGAEFTIKYYDGIYHTVDELPSTAKRTWILVTDESGKAYIRKPESYLKEKSDELYYDSEGNIVLPLGTITIEETKAPEGYTLEGASYASVSGKGELKLSSGVYLTQIEADGDVPKMKNGNSYIISDKVSRGDLRFRKTDEAGNGLTNIAFEIKNSAGDKVTVWTDSEGYYSTSSDFALHSKNTNQGNAGDGVWFGSAAVDDSLGALPYDTYTITELRCDANKNTYKSAESVTVTITEEDNEKEVDLGDIVNKRFPTIHTTAKDKVTGSHYSNIAASVTIVDTVDMTNLDIGHQYKLVGVIMDKATNKELIISGKTITAEGSFVADSENMTYDMEFTMSSLPLQGKDIVVFEYLYDEAYPDELIAKHMDINDEGQTIHFPDIEIGTTLTDMEGEKLTFLNHDVKLVDKVKLKNLDTSVSYVMVGRIINKDNGEIVKEVQKLFTVDNPDAEIEVLYEFDGLDAGLLRDDYSMADACCYEYLYSAEDMTELSRHEDIGDEGQTVSFKLKTGKITITREYEENSGGKVKTGDDTPVKFLSGLFILAFIGAVVLLIKRKKLQKRAVNHLKVMMLIIPLSAALYFAPNVITYAASPAGSEATALESDPQEDETVEVTEEDVKEDYQAPKTIEKDNSSYELKDTELVKEYEPITVTSYKETDVLSSEPAHDATMKYEYTDKQGKVHSLTLFYTDTEVMPNESHPVTYQGQISGYDADFWYIGADLIASGTEEMFDEKLMSGILSEAGYEGLSDYRFSFNGEAYRISSGDMVRDFTITAYETGNKYRFNYAATFDDVEYSLKAVNTYQKIAAKVTEEITEATTETNEIVEPEPEPERKLSTAAKVIISSAVVLGVILIVSLLLYLLKGGRKVTDYKSRRDIKRDYKNL